MLLLFKTLFEVKITHEYFLTHQDGTTVFQEALQQDRLNFLNGEFKDNRESINRDLVFEFPESLRIQYESAGLKLIQTYSGFQVLIRVQKRILADGSEVYLPMLPLPDNYRLLVLISPKGGNMETYSNGRLKRNYPATYLFSNEAINGARQFPFLTSPIASYDAAFTYEQGELYLSGSTVREYYHDGSLDKWNDLTGTGFASEADRLLLPGKFVYRFPDPTGLTNAVFSLEDKDGNEVANITSSDPAGLSATITLDFSTKITSLSGDDAVATADLFYLLNVSGDNGYSRAHRIYFEDDTLKTKPWALISIRNSVADASFNLLETDGFLKKRKSGLAVWTQAPVFEIPVKSRFLFWRFIHNKGKELDVSATLTDYLKKENGILISKTPRSLARDFFLLTKEGSTSTAYVPNPVEDALVLDDANRLCVDVSVPESMLFPLTP